MNPKAAGKAEMKEGDHDGDDAGAAAAKAANQSPPARSDDFRGDKVDLTA